MPGEAARKGQTIDEYAAATAETWRKGLEEWGEDGARIQRLVRRGQRDDLHARLDDGPTAVDPAHAERPGSGHAGRCHWR